MQWNEYNGVKVFPLTLQLLLQGQFIQIVVIIHLSYSVDKHQGQGRVLNVSSHTKEIVRYHLGSRAR